jgi:hypothetical protein
MKRVIIIKKQNLRKTRVRDKRPLSYNVCIGPLRSKSATAT